MTYKEFLKNYLSTVSDDEKMKIVAWLLVFPNTTNMSIDELLSEEMKEHGVKEPCDGCTGNYWMPLPEPYKERREE